MPSLRTSMAKGIRFHRILRGMSQTELGRSVGVSFRTVSKWETGAFFPQLSLVPKLAKVFGVSELDLLYPVEDGVGASLPLEKVVKEIKRLRLIRGMSQQELAEKVGVRVLTISRIERGETRFNMRRLPKFAEALGVTEEELLNPDPNAEKPRIMKIHSERQEKTMT